MQRRTSVAALEIWSGGFPEPDLCYRGSTGNSSRILRLHCCQIDRIVRCAHDMRRTAATHAHGVLRGVQANVCRGFSSSVDLFSVSKVSNSSCSILSAAAAHNSFAVA